MIPISTCIKNPYFDNNQLLMLGIHVLFSLSKVFLNVIETPRLCEVYNVFFKQPILRGIRQF